MGQATLGKRGLEPSLHLLLIVLRTAEGFVPLDLLLRHFFGEVFGEPVLGKGTDGISYIKLLYDFPVFSSKFISPFDILRSLGELNFE